MKRLLSVVLGVGLLQSVLVAQNPPPPPPPPKPPAAVPIKPAPPPPPPAPSADAQNIRLELRITDTYSGAPVEKIVSLLVLSGRNGRVRTSNAVPVGASGDTEPVTLNVDAVATVLPRDRVQAQVTFEYRPAPQPGQSGQRPIPPPMLNESLHIMLRNGERLIVSQSADPATDRTVTVELTATILK